MSHKLLILAQDENKYRTLIEEAQLEDLDFATQPADDVDIVLGEPSRINAALGSLPALRWVQSIWAGVEPLLDPAIRRDYVLTNARGVFGELMSEYVIGYLLAHERKIFQRREAQKNKLWDESDTGTLRGKTIGLLGVGSIGAEVALTAKFFGMNVRGYTWSSETSRHVDEYYHPSLESNSSLFDKQEQAPALHNTPALHRFAHGLDYLVNILPNTKDTRNIINAELLNALPPHALVINVGRGPAVDESALIEALNENKIAGAVLDVFEKEPLPKDHLFWTTTPNLLMTFHTAAPSLAEDISNLFFENYELFNKGQPLMYQVDFEKGY
ncbi:MAG: D-2-hydroxyacid dehydrogenase [Anaerolineales bacterium]|uniref:D-2-hydroxyacid dehydrogenase n=1 Tax=Candidatus Villigracilis proximus TaxID=3140683 RepID=UPI003135E21C|nr:D-2-hydroxyacid dehydrogenase [Anaerolineales bacterium]